MDYKKLIEYFMDESDDKFYSPLGTCYTSHTDVWDGKYWYYEGDDFIIDIENFFFKKDYISEAIENYDINSLSLMTAYFFTADGECHHPFYQSMHPNTIFVYDLNSGFPRYILHKGSEVFMVGIKFKKSFFEKFFNDEPENLHLLFWDTRSDILNPIRKISEEIINCNMDDDAGKMFFEAKVKEWFSIVLNANRAKPSIKSMPKSDVLGIENVKRYINDHFNLTIPQKILEEIAFMGGTKLKKSFKKYTNMTITEYTQRKRIEVSDNLLRGTDMKIQDIAKAVGYTSPSRFSALYFKYRGKYPSDVKKELSERRTI